MTYYKHANTSIMLCWTSANTYNCIPELLLGRPLNKLMSRLKAKTPWCRSALWLTNGSTCAICLAVKSVCHALCLVALQTSFVFRWSADSCAVPACYSKQLAKEVFQRILHANTLLQKDAQQNAHESSYRQWACHAPITAVLKVDFSQREKHTAKPAL